ncbi:autotransporter beta-domain protein [Chlamydia ibidis]|uniref:Autotransporter beta-domain protein n=2 Tax=Chlamydia ibidis TaxID=1405396 RepID=S7J5F8_9CHLA|nr:autotransporter domain-containing protein [Chlamydia ibidis]EPP35257.1 autotransporter beta-domain protein [Chlamydia ibidis]EQM62833.1 autotransporter beta-domain protein [Chlamydia ibidis 10-1398/6]
MKRPPLWLLLSSGLALTSSFSFANGGETTAENILLSSKSSYDGNITNQEFSPNTKTSTTNYYVIGNVMIANAGLKPTNADLKTIETGLTSSCFFVSNGDLNFIGNGHSLNFYNIQTKSIQNGNPPPPPPSPQLIPAAIEVKGSSVGTTDIHIQETSPKNIGNLSVQGFSNFSCMFCPPLNQTTSSTLGAIKTTGSSTFINNAYLTFDNNRSPENGGAISSSGITIESSLLSTTFSSNSSAKSGGALYSNKNITISGNRRVVFSKNISTQTTTVSNPASLSSDEHLKLEKTPADKETFPKAESESSIDAVLPKAILNIPLSSQHFAVPLLASISNQEVSQVTTLCGGGAICSGASDSMVTLENNGYLMFTENSSKTQGGAICANKLTLSSGGPVLFLNNSVESSSPKGGAIAIMGDSGTCSITADRGNIIFDGNTIITTSAQQQQAEKKVQSPPTTTRNSIDLSSGCTLKDLRAKSGYGIFFYDPITSEPPKAAGKSKENSQSLNINNPDSTNASVYTGAIVFSGEHVSPENTVSQEEALTENLNVKSKISQPVALKAGSLALRSRAILEVNSFSQDAGSLLVMDLGTTLQTPKTTTGSSILKTSSSKDVTLSASVPSATTHDVTPASATGITISSLGINVGSMINESHPVTIKAQGTSETATVTAISLVDSSGNSYESPNFGKNKTFNNVINISGTPASHILSVISGNTVDSTKQVPLPHYGYQGTWTVTWSDANAKSGNGNKTVSLSWEESGYKVNPERKGSLIPNTLWGNFSDIRAVHNLIENNLHNNQRCLGFWASGLGNFLHKSSSGDRQKFRHNSGGYSLGILGKTNKDNTLSVSFFQIFSSNKDFLVSKNSATAYGTSLCYQHTNYWKGWSCLGITSPVTLNTLLSYTYASNRVKTEMTTTYAPAGVTYPKLKGDWGNNTLAVECEGSTIISTPCSRIFDNYAPFLKLQLIYAHQGDFQENDSTYGRYFDSSSLTNLSLPLGIRFEKHSKKENASYNLTLIYSPDVIRSNPESHAHLLNDPNVAKWVSKGTNLARQAFILRTGNRYMYSPNILLLGEFNFEIRGSSHTYNVNLGSKICF